MFEPAAPAGRFVYGLTLHGWDDLPELTSEGAAPGQAGPAVSLTTRSGQLVTEHPLDAQRSAEAFGPAHQWVLDRAGGTAELVGPRLDRDLLAHPCLASVATAFNRWARREAFHAGSFVLDGAAYGVLGPRTAGKSTMMAGLAARGHTVLGDDILISDGQDAFAGPRCVDLRTPIPGLELVTASARLGTRWRLALPPAPSRVPLGGWIFLHWGPELALRRCPPSEVLTRLAPQRGRRQLGSDPTVLLDLAARPAWHLTRPRAWSSFEPTTDLLMAALAHDSVSVRPLVRR